MFILGIPFIVFLAWLLARTHRYLAVAPGALARFMAGFAVLLTGSLVMDTLSNAVDLFSMPYNLMILAEELLEMAGMTLILWSCLSLAVASVPLRNSLGLAALTDALTAPERDRLASVPFSTPLTAKNPRT